MDRLRDPQQVKPLRSSFYQVRLLTVWTGVTIICIVFTIIYAYNATRASPFWPGILPSDPSQTIRILNILSHVTVFLLQTLTAGLFETIRWVFAARNGVTAFTFLSLSSGTSYLGVLYLLFRRANRRSNWRTSHHIWGFQRYVFVCSSQLRVASSSCFYIWASDSRYLQKSASG